MVSCMLYGTVPVGVDPIYLHELLKARLTPSSYAAFSGKLPIDEATYIEHICKHSSGFHMPLNNSPAFG